MGQLLNTFFLGVAVTHRGPEQRGRKEEEEEEKMEAIRWVSLNPTIFPTRLAHPSRAPCASEDGGGGGSSGQLAHCSFFKPCCLAPLRALQPKLPSHSEKLGGS